MARHMLIVGTEVHTMLAKMSIGCLMVSLTGCVAATEDAATEGGAAKSPSAAPACLASEALSGDVFELGRALVSDRRKTGGLAPNGLLDDVEVSTKGGDRRTTSERGIFCLEGLRPDSQSEISFRKAGYVSAFVQAVVTTDRFCTDCPAIANGVAEAGLMSVAGARAFAEAAGASPLGETGGVVVMMMESGYGRFPAVAGAAFAVHATNSAHSIYADDRGLADAALTSTSSAGWGAAFGIAPGKATIEVLHGPDGWQCGWWSEQATELFESVQVEVHAGELSVVTIRCF